MPTVSPLFGNLLISFAASSNLAQGDTTILGDTSPRYSRAVRTVTNAHSAPPREVVMCPSAGVMTESFFFDQPGVVPPARRIAELLWQHYLEKPARQQSVHTRTHPPNAMIFGQEHGQSGLLALHLRTGDVVFVQSHEDAESSAVRTRRILEMSLLSSLSGNMGWHRERQKKAHA